MQKLPPSLVDHTTLSKASVFTCSDSLHIHSAIMQMSYLLFDPSTTVQQMAYELLREAAHKRTEHLVIEAGVDTESVVKSVLPWELVLLLQQSLDIVDIEEDLSSVSRRRRCQSIFINPAAENVRILAWLDDRLGSIFKCCE
jgi:hypothetical protein